MRWKNACLVAVLLCSPLTAVAQNGVRIMQTHHTAEELRAEEEKLKAEAKTVMKQLRKKNKILEHDPFSFYPVTLMKQVFVVVPNKTRGKIFYVYAFGQPQTVKEASPEDLKMVAFKHAPLTLK